MGDYEEIRATLVRLRIWTKLRRENGAELTYFQIGPTWTITLLDSDIEQVCDALEKRLASARPFHGVSDA